MTEEQIRQLIRDELKLFVGSNHFIFEKDIQIMNGRNIQVGRSVGTSIGTGTDQKVSVYGVDPVVQAGAIGSPSADVGALKVAVDAIRTAIKNFGITA